MIGKRRKDRKMKGSNDCNNKVVGEEQGTNLEIALEMFVKLSPEVQKNIIDLVKSLLSAE